MRLGIISDCIHFKHPDGRIGTENHILLKQLEALAFYFDGIVLCSPFVAYDDHKVASYYSKINLTIVPVINVGGDDFNSKIKLVKAIPTWWKAFQKVHQQSDIVYQRFPNNLNIPGFFYFYFKQKKVFATFTGTWENYPHEPFTYRLQKWLLKNYFRGPVWAYLEKPSGSSRIKNGTSPSYNQSVWNEETEQVQQRIKKLNQPLHQLRLITVGNFNVNKNQQLILKACLQLHQANIPFKLTLVGDGVLKNEYQQFIDQHQLNQQINIAGKKTAEELRALYREHDFVVQAPIREGFGKVPVEGFFHGLIPILSNITLAKAMSGNNNERGFVFENGNPETLFKLLVQIFENKFQLPDMIISGRNYAASQTLEAWASGYFKEINEYCNL